MTPLADRVFETVRRRRLFPQGARVLAAVSGGPDSVALLYLLHELASASRLHLAGLAHLDHRLRGSESARDAEFCRQLADSVRLPLEMGSVDVAGEMARRRTSLEETARAVRYDFLEGARVRLGAEVVAVGHTRDDQAETVLLRLLRGAGTRGMSGIHPRAGTVVRPLLDISRRDVVRYLASRGLSFVEDSSNRDVTRARNRIRHEILPALTAGFGEAVPAVLARQADIAREDDAVLAGLAAEAASRIVQSSKEQVALAVEPLQREPPAIARRVVQRAIEGLGEPRPGLVHIDAVLALLAAGRPASLDLPGRRRAELRRAGGVLVIRRHSAAVRSDPADWAHHLPIPGRVAVPEAGLTCLAVRQPFDHGRGLPFRAGGLTATLAGTEVGPTLVIRAWQPGDRLRPLGLGGQKKVQDLFVDRKVPRAHRGRVPIVTDESGRIVWVAGHALAEAFRVTPATKSVVVLSFEPLGGPA